MDDAPPALITFYDDRTGERSAVSAAELGDWSAATAALLVDGCGLRPGDRAAVLLLPHWQSAAVLLGAWSAGLEVSYQVWAAAGLQRPDHYDVTFVAASRVGSWLEEVPPGRHQFVLGDAPEGYRSWAPSVRPYLGVRPPLELPDDASPATTDGTTFGALGSIATEIAHTRGIRRGDRLLVDVAAHEQPLSWLLAPLAVGASVVLCANLDRERLDERVAAEQVTKVVL
jgi:uncharacterized protein (TIGR03089 family)